jgi:O-antigen ligase
MPQPVSRFKSILRAPLVMLLPLWPLVLLTPHLPGFPVPSVNGLPWRQELALCLLLSASIGFLFLKKKAPGPEVRIDRSTLAVLASGVFFALWILVSSAWATDTYPAIHLGLQWTIYLIFFALIILAPFARQVRSSFIVLAVVIWILSIACTIESWFGAPLTDFNLRSDLKPLLRGLSGFGEVMGPSCILFAAFALHVRRRRAALICGLTALAGWLSTVQSLERAPLLGTVSGLLLLLFGLFIRPRGRDLKRLGLLFTGFALVFLLQTGQFRYFLKSAAPADHISVVTRLQQHPATDANAQVRFLFWRIALEMAHVHPLLGVGGNNYQVIYPEARAQFAVRNMNSPLLAANEDLLAGYAHNEYLQMLAELGVMGFLLFVLFSFALVLSFWQALKVSRHKLPILGAAGAMLAFAVSSGASAASFRSLGGGLIFFFSGALICRRVNLDHTRSVESSKIRFSSLKLRFLKFASIACTVLAVCVFTAQATGSTLQAIAEGPSNDQAEWYYRESLRVFPASASTHFAYGTWLASRGRGAESARYLEYATQRGFNSSVCYEFLGAAQGGAGNLVAAEQTFAKAVVVYPRSVFLLVRHAEALKRLGRIEDSQAEFSRALMIDARAARGWQQLIVNDIDAAYLASAKDNEVVPPGDLTPQAAMLSVLHENEMLNPNLANSGWRKRMRSIDFGKSQ